jgi:hypothetical protein
MTRPGGNCKRTRPETSPRRTQPKRKDVGAEAALSRWREQLYGCPHSRADALFNLTDAVVAAVAVPSMVHLSLAAVHCRC